MALANPARLGGAFILLALLGAGCGGGSGDDGPPGADTEATATEESPAVRDGELLLQDDFSDPKSGWPSVMREEGRADYVEGAYRIVAKQAGRQVWSHVAGPTVRGLRSARG